MFAAHRGLGNLCAVLDLDGQQAFGRTCDVMNAPNMAERWRAFGWRVSEVDGHSVEGLATAMNSIGAPDVPHVVIAKTTFGKGVSYMEQGIPVSQTHLAVEPFNWHYLPMSDHEFDLAMAELEEAN
jgi:transketolase